MRVMRESNVIRYAKMKYLLTWKKSSNRQSPKTITVLEPPLGGRGLTTGNETHSINVYKD
jgi:hypothetical protein